MLVVLDLAAPGACQIASKQGFEHQEERIFFAAIEFLRQNVGSNSPHL